LRADEKEDERRGVDPIREYEDGRVEAREESTGKPKGVKLHGVKKRVSHRSHTAYRAGA
jgi:hypothetical protein